MIEALGGTPFGGFLQNTKAQLALLGVGSAFIALGVAFLSISQGPALSTLGNVMVGLGTPLTLSGLISLIYNKCVNQSQSGQIKKQKEEKGSESCIKLPWGKSEDGYRLGNDANLNITTENDASQSQAEKDAAFQKLIERKRAEEEKRNKELAKEMVGTRDKRPNEEKEAHKRAQERYDKSRENNPPPPKKDPKRKKTTINDNNKKLGGNPINKDELGKKRADKLEN